MIIKYAINLSEYPDSNLNAVSVQVLITVIYLQIFKEAKTQLNKLYIDKE